MSEAYPDRLDPSYLTGPGMLDWLHAKGIAVKVTDDGRMSLVGQTQRLTLRDRAAVLHQREHLLAELRPDLRPFGPIPCDDAVDRWILRTQPAIRTAYQLVEFRQRRRFRLDSILQAAALVTRGQDEMRRRAEPETEPIPY